MGTKFTTFVSDAAKYVQKKAHGILDYLSYNMCQERPSYRLATDNLHIPAEDLSVLMQILSMIATALGLVIVPIQMLNDKKFVIHIYETATVFTSFNNPTPQNIVTTCEKMLMFIAQNRGKIIEPRDKQVIKTATLHNNDYDIPVNYWYTLNINNNKVYFFAHISVLHNYRGVVLAVDNRRDITILSTLKQSAIDLYDQNLGVRSTPQNRNKIMDFI